MDKEAVRQLLPEEPPAEVVNMAYRDHFSQLGGNITIYKRVNMTRFPELQREMSPDDWDEFEHRSQNIWAAECTCTCCGETWYTAWGGGPMKSIFVVIGEDGQTYPFYNDSPEQGDAVELTGNDGFLCPVCGEGTTLTHVDKVRSGFMRRLLIMSVGNAGKYTAIFYWLLYRRFDIDGDDYRHVEPWNAYVIDENGRLHRYCHKNVGWVYSKLKNDAYYSKYVSGDGDIYNHRYGGHVCNIVPSQLGCTGEKTGLAEYVRNDGQMPLLYLKTWQQKPTIENLVNAGWARLISAKIDRESDPYEISVANLQGIDCTKTRPHEMLGMDKASFRAINKGNGCWSAEEFDAWRSYKTFGGGVTAQEFDRYWTKFTNYGITTVVEAMAAYDVDLPKIDRYMQKQALSRTEVRLLTDTWKMTGILYGRTELTHEEMWPKDLVKKHDELSELNIQEQGKDGWARYLSGFKMIQDKYGEIQWTDGDLCIRLPANNGDLIREGSVLRHCVGNYGKTHVTEETVIFFVRRYRRPERCYYTLCMDMRGNPKRTQLHGYGNERHGACKQYVHSIPRKVLDFCDRWEKEILRKWYLEQKRKTKEAKTE